MSKIIERLKLDHLRLGRVLSELASVADQAADGSASAEDRLFCMLDYLKEYPHEIHHPVEDIVFSQTLNKILTEEQSQIIDDNASQHRSLEQETERLLAAVDNDTPDLEKLRSLTRTYVEHQTQHMQHEETVVFPLVQKLLSAKDWLALEGQYNVLRDPMFDAADSRFNAVYRCLGVDPNNPNLGVGSVLKFLNAV